MPREKQYLYFTILYLSALGISIYAQTTCNNGLGRVLYERLPNQQLQGFDDDVVRDTAPPFRVLEKCQDLCLRDRTATTNVLRACASFDFQPGSRITSFSGNAEYEESTCYLTREQAAAEGIGNLMLVPNSVHFNEICLSSSRPERECPSRRYVFERHPRKKLKLPLSDIKEISAANRTDCEDKCLNEFTFVCRSANYDSSLRICSLSRFTRRTHPELMEDDSNSNYLENTCLNAERRCDGLAVFVKEENKRLGGPFEVDIFNNMTLEECQTMCLRAEKYFCRSVEYDDQTKQCILSEEDSVSQKDDISISSSPTHHFYDLVCLDNQRSNEYPDNSVTSHLFSGGRRPDTAFQRYRNSRLGGEFHSEITGRSLSECLDECLRQTSFQCRSAVYSDRFRTCRLSRYNQRDGMRIIYDADYDYYENLMLNVVGGDNNDRPHSRPDGSNSMDFRPHSYYPSDRDKYPNNRPPIRDPVYDDRYPYDKHPDYSGYEPDKYPDDRYAPDRNPVVPDRYPPYKDRNHLSVYNHYPAQDVSLDRYPSDRNRFPLDDPFYNDYNRYPGDSDRFRPDRYRPPIDNKFPIDDRYPPRIHRPDDIYHNKPVYLDTRFPSYYHYDTSYNSREYPYRPAIDNRFPDKRQRPSSFPHLRPDEPSQLYPENIPIRRRPSQGYLDEKRYPPIPPLTSPNRFPVGNSRSPIDIYKYGNRRPGYARPPPNYYDLDYDERLGDRGIYPRLPPPGFDLTYDNDFDGGFARRPIYPPYDGMLRPVRPIGYDNSNNIVPVDGFGVHGPGRPSGVRCDDTDSFKQVLSRHKMRRHFVRRSLTVPSLIHCQQECTNAKDFICRSFNYRESTLSYDTNRETPNCELSDRDSRELDVHNPNLFDPGNFDFYERSFGRGNDDDCLDVSQVCSDEGMEFTLKTPDGFNGRIYTYGFFDRCFFRGNGGTVNVLRISGPQGYPECGTQRYGDTLTNIVVVQFSDNVQTGRDKRYNLTCVFRGPGEAVVTSGYIGAGSGSPIPIEYLPAENTLSSKVRLQILYQGRPTTTIAVGDPLTFRLESQDGYSHATDIFATNVVARDPYSGRSIQLIDRFGCPVDPYVFPELDKLRDGDMLEARFNAFKIPESNFLVFEATVRTCKDGCQPAYCPGPAGRSEQSFGRRRREISTTENGTNTEMEQNFVVIQNESLIKNKINKTAETSNKVEDIITEEPEQVREMIEVFDSRDEIESQIFARKLIAPPVETVCLTQSIYNGLITALILLLLLLFSITLLSGFAYRRYWKILSKNRILDRNSPINPFHTSSIQTHEPFSEINPTKYNSRPSLATNANKLPLFGGNLQRTFATGNLSRICQIPIITPSKVKGNNSHFEDPSEPIYTDPSLFERSRSLRSISLEDEN